MYTQEISTKVSMWWGFSAANNWTLPIRYAKRHTRRKIPFRSGALAWCRPKTFGMRMSILVERSKDIACVYGVFGDNQK